MTATVDAKKLPAIIERLRRNETKLIAESQALGFTHNGPLRAALKEKLGEEGYNSLMESKRPVAKSGEKITKSIGTVERPKPNDEGLPLLQSMKKSEGWSWRLIPEHAPRPRKVELPKGEGNFTVMDSGRRIPVMISPEGFEYIEAYDDEKADLLRVHPSNPDRPPCRFVLFEGSRREKEYKRDFAEQAEEMRRGEAGLERKKARVQPAEAVVEMPPDQHVERILAKAVEEGVQTTPKKKAKPNKMKEQGTPPVVKRKSVAKKGKRSRKVA